MIVVAGKNNIAVHALNSLVDRLGNQSVIALPNRNDTAQNSWQQSLRLAASKRGVREASLQEIEEIQVNILLSLEYDRIINPRLFPNTSLFNFHFSCLPRYKGVYTSIWPILYGDDESGVTLHEIDQGIDTGNICAQKSFKISNADRARDLYRKYIDNAIALFDDQIDNILSGRLKSEPQSPKRSSYFAKSSIDFSKLAINLQCTAWELQRQLYAYNFREYQIPSVFGQPIVDIDITNEKSTCKPGTLLNNSNGSLVISTIDYNAILYVDLLSDVLDRMKSCNAGNLPSLLKNISGIHDRNDKGWSPLIVAAYYGNFEAVEYLLNQGANPNDSNYNGTTVLMYAKDFTLKQKNNSVFHLLRAAGADPRIRDFDGRALEDYVTSDEASYLGL